MSSSRTLTGPTAQDVDAAVRSVLSAMALAARVNGVKPIGTGEVFAGRLLSLRETERLPGEIREVKIAPGTVVTPLARDHLKRRGIGLKIVSRSEADRVGNAGEWGFSIESGTGVMEAFRRALLDGADEWRDLGASLDDATGWVAGAKRRGALVLTEEASIAVYRACQRAGVRAAAAEDAGAAARAVRALGVNLLVVEPAGKPIALLRQIGATFRRLGGPVAPDWMDHSNGRQPS